MGRYPSPTRRHDGYRFAGVDREGEPMHPVEIEYWGGPVDGNTQQLLAGADGLPPAWCLVPFSPPQSVLDGRRRGVHEEHRYVRDATARPGRPWRYRYDGRAT